MNTDKIYAEQIANEYAPKQTSKVKALKKLDAKVKNPPFIIAMIIGVLSSLILGVGMCLSMSIIGSGSGFMIALGIVVGCIGIWGVSINYPLYKAMLKRAKDKYAGDIIKLAEEIISEQE